MIRLHPSARHPARPRVPLRHRICGTVQQKMHCATNNFRPQTKFISTADEIFFVCGRNSDELCHRFHQAAHCAPFFPVRQRDEQRFSHFPKKCAKNISLKISIFKEKVKRMCNFSCTIRNFLLTLHTELEQRILWQYQKHGTCWSMWPDNSSPRTVSRTRR